MVTVTLTIPDSVKEELRRFSWVNWSEVARHEFIKKEIFFKFLKTGTISKEDQKYCDSIDWYPIDDLPLKEAYVKMAKSRKYSSSSKTSMSAAEFEKWCDSL